LEQLLDRLFDLMEKSDSIRTLPAERKEKIRAKYRLSNVDAVENAIRMLEKDISDKEERRAQSQKALTRSTEKLRELKRIDDEEKLVSEKLADEMLERAGLVKIKKSNADAVLIFLLLAAIAGLAAYYFFLR
jgi:hypothetical protein